MATPRPIIAAIIAAMSLTAGTGATEPAQQASFTAGKGDFLLNGKPFAIKAAELHYPRIPRQYWDHRIKMCKALGMNTICLYTFWNAHEPEEGSFDFSGQNDLRAFIELCRDNDMKVILRPGPYVCAEWEMGGLPWWLLRIPDIRLRENDPRFLEKVDRFQKEVAKQVNGLSISEGGPIIMMQVENEYGSYGHDREYVAAIRDMLRRNFGNDITLFQCDWASNFELNGLDDLIWTMNFGTGADIDSQFARLRELRPESPLMCSEFWSGWFDKWGANHETRPAADMIAGIEEMMSKGISFSLYMTHGGTNWGHWAGANTPGYAPDVTSYDYDAPISEQGAPTPKYHLLRQMMQRHADKPLPPLPDPIPTASIDTFTLTETAPLFSNLPDPIHVHGIRTMESFGQGFGSMLYRTIITDNATAPLLTVTEPHDFAQIFVNGRLCGTLDRREAETSLSLPDVCEGDTLDILVEATGRINFGREINDRKGITGKVELTTAAGQPTTLNDWDVFLLPDSKQFYSAMDFSPIPASPGKHEPGVYRGTFVTDKPSDTYLNFSRWGKGLVYVNGHPLGRIWSIGPQQTLYMPGVWLNEGENEIMVFDITGPQQTTVWGQTTPELDMLQTPGGSGNMAPQALNLDDDTMAATVNLQPGNGWKEAMFGKTAAGRYLCIETTASHSGDDYAAIAELYLIGTDGHRLPRNRWKAIYADSQEMSGNHTAEKAFDLQESTYWATAPGSGFPHTIVIDLGENIEATGIQCIPRAENGAPGAVSSARIYLSDKSPVTSATH